jgi:hypothetical protein
MQFIDRDTAKAAAAARHIAGQDVTDVFAKNINDSLCPSRLGRWGEGGMTIASR